MTSVPRGKCGPCCSVAASGNTAIHCAAAAGETSGQWMSVQSRGGGVEVIERNVFFRRICRVVYEHSPTARAAPGPAGYFPIMGQNDRRSPIMKPPLLPRALTAALMTVLLAI